MKLRSAALLILTFALVAFADDSNRLLRVDHFVQVHSTVPAIAGQLTEIYVREVVEAGTALLRLHADFFPLGSALEACKQAYLVRL